VRWVGAWRWHEYPERDLPYAEDLGRKARVFKITGLVIGPDYMAQRDALLAACEQPGPGTLVHPYHGTMEVVCQACTYREETRAGGRASFSFTFMGAGQRNYPAVELDFTAQAAGAAGNVGAVAGEVFAQVYQTTGPAWLAAASAGDFRTALAWYRPWPAQSPAFWTPARPLFARAAAAPLAWMARR
jgi:prophage DNA circulation protein